jgi:ribosomal protein S21
MKAALSSPPLSTGPRADAWRRRLQPLRDVALQRLRRALLLVPGVTTREDREYHEKPKRAQREAAAGGSRRLRRLRARGFEVAVGLWRYRLHGGDSARF